jgi:hypothetical protein
VIKTKLWEWRPTPKLFGTDGKPIGKVHYALQ